jgi:DNA replication initiation complex subunit (GINS family)
MITKEKVKKEIDKMPNDVLEKVYRYINSLKTNTSKKKKIHTFNLKGQFDDLNIRERAYE